MKNDKLKCPYCGAEQLTHEPDTFNIDECAERCESCGRVFWYAVKVTRHYDAWRDINE